MLYREKLKVKCLCIVVFSKIKLIILLINDVMRYWIQLLIYDKDILKNK